MPDTRGHCPEVLAPAGGWESLEAAVRSGADAVYLGGKSLNARRNAKGFDDGEIAAATAYCHTRGVKLYFTLNTLVFDSESRELAALLERICAAGVDAVIIQDLAVAALARRCAPGLPLHASTQMSVHDAGGVQVLEELGFSRVVLARELSREEIAAIRRGTDMELELFVHGALCMCVSGQCYLSSMIGGRSGNRGLCAQPCRLPFSGGGKAYALSLRDLSLIRSAAALQELGVTGLKIEGRMKRPEYVAAAVTACRSALAGESPDFAALEAVFSRSGFTSGYFDGATGPDMFGTRRHEDVAAAAPVLRELAGLYKEERQCVPVEMALTMTRGAPAALEARDDQGNTAKALGPEPQDARTAPTTPERALAALGKTGGTSYTVSNFSAVIDNGLMLPASALNALRREVLEELSALRGRPRPHAYTAQPQQRPQPHRGAAKPRLRVRLARAEQLEAVGTADEITLPAEEFPRCDRELLVRYSDRLLVEIPSVVFDRQEKLNGILQDVKSMGVGGAVVGGLGGIALARGHGFALHGDYGLNITNTAALAQYAQLGLTDATVSFELSLAQIRSLGGVLPRGMLAWGHLPLMAARCCPAGSCKQCGRSLPTLTDRKGNRFFVDCTWKVSRLYNHLPLFLADRLEELRGVDFLTLYFTRETPEQCEALLGRYRNGGTYTEPMTRGLYYRKVL